MYLEKNAILISALAAIALVLLWFFTCLPKSIIVIGVGIGTALARSLFNGKMYLFGKKYEWLVGLAVVLVVVLVLVTMKKEVL